MASSLFVHSLIKREGAALSDLLDELANNLRKPLSFTGRDPIEKDPFRPDPGHLEELCG